MLRPYINRPDRNRPDRPTVQHSNRPTFQPSDQNAYRSVNCTWYALANVERATNALDFNVVASYSRESNVKTDCDWLSGPGVRAVWISADWLLKTGLSVGSLICPH